MVHKIILAIAISITFCIQSFSQSKLSVTDQKYNEHKEAGDKYYDDEEYYLAAQEYHKAEKLKPTDHYILWRLAESYRQYQDYDDAEVWYRKLCSTPDNKYPLALFQLGLMEKINSKYIEAEGTLSLFIKNFKPVTEEDKLELKEAEFEYKGCVYALELLRKPVKQNNFKLLPAPVNSKAVDYAPMIFFHDSSIVITSQRSDSKGSELNLATGEARSDNFRFEKNGAKWVRHHNDDNFDIVNTPKDDGAGELTHDHNKYYYTICDPECDIFVSKKVAGKFTKPLKLNKNINIPNYWNAQPTVSPTADTMFFVSKRPNGKSPNAKKEYDHDIWMSINKDKTGATEDWGTAINLTNINTPYIEIAPFWDDHTNTIYFASNGHVGFGGWDIYQAKGKNRDSIINLGMPFNSARDDFYFTLGKDKGYLVSNREGGIGKDDIYTFDIKVKESTIGDVPRDSFVDAQSISSVGRIILNDTQKPVADLPVFLKDEAGNTISEGRTNANGEFRFENLPPDKNFKITINENDPRLKTSLNYEVAKKVPLIPNVDATGVLVDKVTKKPLANVPVEIKDASGKVVQTTKTDAAGKYIVKDLVGGVQYKAAVPSTSPLAAKASVASKFTPQTNSALNQTQIAAGTTNANSNTASAKTDVASGNLNVESGKLNVTSGTLNAESGNLNAESGKTNVASGNLNAESGKLNAESGKLNAESGKLNAESGKLNVANGTLNAESVNLPSSNTINSTTPKTSNTISEAVSTQNSKATNAVNNTTSTATTNVDGVAQTNTTPVVSATNSVSTPTNSLNNTSAKVGDAAASSTTTQGSSATNTATKVDGVSTSGTTNSVSTPTNSLNNTSAKVGDVAASSTTTQGSSTTNTATKVDGVSASGTTNSVSTPTNALNSTAPKVGNTTSTINTQNVNSNAKVDATTQTNFTSPIATATIPVSTGTNAVNNAVSNTSTVATTPNVDTNLPAISSSTTINNAASNTSTNNKISSTPVESTTTTSEKTEIDNQNIASNVAASDAVRSTKKPTKVAREYVEKTNTEPDYSNSVSSGTKSRVTIDNFKISSSATKPTKIFFENVYFDFNSAELTAISKKAMDQMVSYYGDHKEIQIEIKAYSDGFGNADYNKQLAEQRGRACYDYFLGRGIDQTALLITPAGENNPVASNNSFAGRQLNRRVEFSIVGSKAPFQPEAMAHVLEPRMTLFSVAKKYGMTMAELKEWNGGINAEDIKAYSVLRVKRPSTASNIAPASVNYVNSGTEEMRFENGQFVPNIK
ncbi:MAG: LysM peptidoglycan-binding domain-containing protein [Bacteroidetes bacterium]|nr:MAG: LysM peptidoglycan-binding domain-containing protein [Bacteroidota bacterium]